MQRTIDAMNRRIALLVEAYNESTVAHARTRARMARLRTRLVQLQRELDEAEARYRLRVRAIYIRGAVTNLEQYLGAVELHDLLRTSQYQRRVLEADNRARTRMVEARTLMRELLAELERQRRQEEALTASLARQREEIQQRVAAERSYLERLNRQLREAVEQERRRQEALRRQAWERRVRAERAARARAGAGRSATGGQVLARSAAPAPRGSARAAELAVAWALRQVGKPYQWGASGPDSFDCSGLVMAAYRAAGIHLPRTSRQQWYAGPHVSPGELRRGDLVFFAEDPSDPATIHHVGLYVGDGMMVEAPYTGATVRVASVGRDDYIGAVRPTGPS